MLLYNTIFWLHLNLAISCVENLVYFNLEDFPVTNFIK